MSLNSKHTFPSNWRETYSGVATNVQSDESVYMCTECVYVYRVCCVYVYRVCTCVQSVYMCAECTEYVHVYRMCTCAQSAQSVYMCTECVHVYRVCTCAQSVYMCIECVHVQSSSLASITELACRLWGASVLSLVENSAWEKTLLSTVGSV